MGEVYLAQDTRLKRHVALKLLPSQFTKDAERLRRFEQEACNASALNHPNIITIYEIGSEGEAHFIATEFIDGDTLRTKIHRDKTGLKKLLEYLTQVVDGLVKAHATGIVHRDLKPDNIMITRDGYAKILDFGLAKLIEPQKPQSTGNVGESSEIATAMLPQHTQTGMVMGTLGYMSPEQAQGKISEIDQRSDIFSFGCILYEAATRHKPFEGDSIIKSLHKICYEQAPPMTDFNPGAPVELQRIVRKCLEKDLEERYQTIKDLAIDLRRLRREMESKSESSSFSAPTLIGISMADNKSQSAMSTTPDRVAQTVAMEAPPSTSAEYLVRGIKRNKRVIALVGLAMIVLMAAAVFALKGFWGEPASVERIPIAVADFVNETKEEELNGLSGMLITSLEQSRRLSVLTRSRMFDILKRSGKENVDRIDETLGGEVCKQANVNALVTASIRKFDQLYIIDLKVLDPHKNEYLFTAKEEGQGKASIPSMIDSLSEKTRLGLKEKGTEVQATSQKVAETTTTNLEAYEHYFQGEQFINKLKFKEAEEEFNKAIALDSTFALAYYRLAYATSWFGGERAVKPMLKAMQYIGKAPAKEQYLIRAYNAKIQEKRDEAIGIYKELLKSYPEEKEALFEVGDLSVHKADHSTAIMYFEKVLAIDPAFELALGHIIWTYELTEQYDKALEYAKQYVAKLPSEEAYRELGQVYVLQGDFNDALQTYRRALEAFPNSTMPVRGTGEVYIFRNEYVKAEAEFKKLLQEDRSLKDKRDGLRSLALLDAYQGKYREVIKTFDQIIELDMKLGDTTGLARSNVQKAYWLAITNSRGEESKSAISKALELSTVADNRFYITLIYAYVLTAEYEKASSIAKNQLAEYYPFDTLVSGYAHRARNEYDAAIRDFQELSQHGLTEQKVTSWYDLAQCYLETEQNAKAIDAIQKMQRIYYNYYGNRAALYPKSFYLLGKIYEKNGDKKLAIESYEKFLNLWKDADKDLPELSDAQAHLAKLK